MGSLAACVFGSMLRAYLLGEKGLGKRGKMTRKSAEFRLWDPSSGDGLQTIDYIWFMVGAEGILTRVSRLGHLLSYQILPGDKRCSLRSLAALGSEAIRNARERLGIEKSHKSVNSVNRWGDKISIEAGLNALALYRGIASR